MGFGFQQQQQHSVQRSLVHESSIHSPIRMQSRWPARAPTFSNCERARMTPVLLDHEYSRGGHSALSIHFFLTLSSEANSQIRCGRTGTSRHEDTAVAHPSDLPQTKQPPVLFYFKTTACFGGHKRPIKNFLNLIYVFVRDLTYKVQSINFPCTDFWSL